MIEIRKLSTCSFDAALDIWNRGFEGYFMDMTFTMDRLVGRFGLDGLSPDLSVVACVDGELAGFVLNGIRMVKGTKVAWNGGTGVATKFRGQGIGAQLVEASLQVYRDADVQLATLEAIAKNEPAIRLYEKMGYVTVDRVTFLQRRGTLAPNTFTERFSYVERQGIPADVANLDFYGENVAWQAHWASIRDGESLVLLEAGQPVGYALFKRTLGESGSLNAIALYQCEVAPHRTDARAIIEHLLFRLYAPHEVDCLRYTINARMSNEILMDVLQQAGFTTLSEQVYMERKMEA